MKRKHYIIIASVLVVIIAAIILKPGKGDALKQLSVKVERGKFEILVTTTGELQAKSSVDIEGPSELRNSRGIRIREIKIQDLIPEGTVVDSGDYVARLDPSELANNLKDLSDEVESSESNYLKTVPGKGWFTLLRLYSPTQPFFDQTWKPGDFEKIK